MESIFHRALVPFSSRMERERVPVGDRAFGCGRVVDRAPAPFQLKTLGVPEERVQQISQRQAQPDAEEHQAEGEALPGHPVQSGLQPTLDQVFLLLRRFYPDLPVGGPSMARHSRPEMARKTVTRVWIR